MLTPAQATELQRIGVNNDGGISAKGARAAARSAAELRASVSMWKKSVLVTFLLLLISWLGNGGLTAAVVNLSKDMQVKDSGTLSDANGHVVAVRSAKVALPLRVAPVMDGARLAAINEVSITILDGPDGTLATATTHFLKVKKVQLFNNTAAIFSVANSEAVFVWNGETTFVDANGTTYSVCEATTTCAALYVDNKAEKEQLEAQADDALVAGGFMEAADRRRLQPLTKCTAKVPVVSGQNWVYASPRRRPGTAPIPPPTAPPDPR